MKRIMNVIAATLALLFTTAICAGAQQSLGDLARRQRESKRPPSAKVYTNDDFTSAPAATAEAVPAESSKADRDKEKQDKAKAAAGSDADKAKLADSLKSKVSDQKKEIAQLEREIDVSQRENRLRVAAYYADAGNSLRDGKKWAEEDRKQRAEIEQKQKALADAKQKLDDLQEQARRAAVRVD